MQNVDRFRKVENRYEVKKEADFKVIDNWVQPGESVLDLGCGRGILLEYLRDTKQVRGLGVDYDRSKATSSIARGVAVYQEDIRRALENLGDQSFDWVIFSRMIEELPQPGSVLLEALRVGKRVALSFVNHGYWRNRLHFLGRGMKIRNAFTRTIGSKVVSGTISRLPSSRAFAENIDPARMHLRSVGKSIIRAIGLKPVPFGPISEAWRSTNWRK